jgi:hypothetical protein
VPVRYPRRPPIFFSFRVPAAIVACWQVILKDRPTRDIEKSTQSFKKLSYNIRMSFTIRPAPIFLFLPFSREYQNEQSFNDISTKDSSNSTKVCLVKGPSTVNYNPKPSLAISGTLNSISSDTFPSSEYSWQCRTC